MKTKLTQYQNIQVGDKIFTNGADNHAFRKLNFQEIEIVSEIKKYLSRGAGVLVLVAFESKNQTLGIFDRNLEVLI